MQMKLDRMVMEAVPGENTRTGEIVTLDHTVEPSRTDLISGDNHHCANMTLGPGTDGLWDSLVR